MAELYVANLPDVEESEIYDFFHPTQARNGLEQVSLDLDCSRGGPGLEVELATPGQHNIQSQLYIQRLLTTAQTFDAQTAPAYQAAWLCRYRTYAGPPAGRLCLPHLMITKPRCRKAARQAASLLCYRPEKLHAPKVASCLQMMRDRQIRVEAAKPARRRLARGVDLLGAAAVFERVLSTLRHAVRLEGEEGEEGEHRDARRRRPRPSRQARNAVCSF